MIKTNLVLFQRLTIKKASFLYFHLWWTFFCCCCCCSGVHRKIINDNISTICLLQININEEEKIYKINCEIGDGKRIQQRFNYNSIFKDKDKNKRNP